MVLFSWLLCLEIFLISAFNLDTVFQERMCVFLAKEEAESACGRGDGSVDSRPIICTADVCVCVGGCVPECVYEAGERGKQDLKLAHNLLGVVG